MLFVAAVSAERGGVTMILHSVVMRRLTSYPYKAGRSTPGFRLTLLAITKLEEPWCVRRVA